MAALTRLLVHLAADEASDTATNTVVAAVRVGPIHGSQGAHAAGHVLVGAHVCLELMSLALRYQRWFCARQAICMSGEQILDLSTRDLATLRNVEFGPAAGLSLRHDRAELVVRHVKAG